MVLRVVIGVWLVLWGSGVMAELPVNTKLGGDFTLPSTLSKETGIREFKGKVILLNFGFTHCPDVCPMVLNRMAQVLTLDSDYANEVVPVFVTIDPERDTVEHLTEYLRFFGPTFVGFSGDAKALAAVAKQYGVVALPATDNSGKVDYTHSDFIYLIDQQGRVRALYGQQDKLKKIESDINQLL